MAPRKPPGALAWAQFEIVFRRMLPVAVGWFSASAASWMCGSPSFHESL